MASSSLPRAGPQKGTDEPMHLAVTFLKNGKVFSRLQRQGVPV